jgi:Tfp pilus assembly protein PilN
MAGGKDRLNSLEDVMRAHRLLTDAELARLTSGVSDKQVERALGEYKLCRVLLDEALRQRDRILTLEEGERGRG